MKRVIVTSDPPVRLSGAHLAQLRALDGRAPDTADIPEASDESWRGARRFFKPRKEAVSLRLDADVLDWLRRTSDRCQSRINQILRKEMETQGG